MPGQYGKKNETIKSILQEFFQLGFVGVCVWLGLGKGVVSKQPKKKKLKDHQKKRKKIKGSKYQLSFRNFWNDDSSLDLNSRMNGLSHPGTAAEVNQLHLLSIWVILPSWNSGRSF